MFSEVTKDVFFLIFFTVKDVEIGIIVHLKLKSDYIVDIIHHCCLQAYADNCFSCISCHILSTKLITVRGQ